MKKLLIILIVPILLFTQTVKVSDLVGDWYGADFNIICGSNPCSFGAIQKDPAATKVSISIKDSILEVLSNAKFQAQDFYETDPLINYIFTDTLRLPIVAGAVDWPLIQTSDKGLYLQTSTSASSQMIHSMLLTRNAKNYLKLLLTSNRWTGILGIINDSTFSVVTQITEHRFEDHNDTLIIHPYMTKFSYDSAAQVYRNVTNISMTMYLKDPYTLMFETSYKGSLQDAEIIRNKWISLVNDWTNCAGIWQSTTRPNVFIEVISSDIQKTQVLTNSIDLLHTIKIPTHNIEFAILTEVDTLKTEALTDGYNLYVNVPDAKILPTLSPPSFSINKTVNTLSYTGLSMKNILTGEQFSKVIAIDEVGYQTQISLKSNPVTDEAEINGLDQFDYILYSSMGQCVAQGNTNTGKIQMTAHASGIYILKLRSKDQELVFRVLKQ